MAPNDLPLTLLDLLGNRLILSRIVPFVPPSALVSLAATSQSMYSLVFITHSSYTFRHLDLSNLNFSFVFPSLRHMNSDGYDLAAPSPSTFYVLKKRAVLQYVTTLILDGLTVPASVSREILCDDAFNVRVLSIRDVKELDEEQLMQILRYLVRPSRPKDNPKLKGLYYFTHRESEGRVTNPDKYHPGQYHVSDPNLPVPKTWVNGGGSLFSTDEIAMKAWIQLIEACRDIIAFDVVVCHHAPGSDAPPELASVALGINGCHNCHSTPEAPRIFGQTPTHDLPLLSPPPLFASTVKAAQSPAPGESHRFYARCSQCLDDRWCYRCNAWWCENCCTPPAKAGELSPKLVSEFKIYAVFVYNNDFPKIYTPVLKKVEKDGLKVDLHLLGMLLISSARRSQAVVARQCYECGWICDVCTSKALKGCQRCNAKYCVLHDEPCSATECDWCSSSGRRRGREDIW